MESGRARKISPDITPSRTNRCASRSKHSRASSDNSNARIGPSVQIRLPNGIKKNTKTEVKPRIAVIPTVLFKASVQKNQVRTMQT